MERYPKFKENRALSIYRLFLQLREIKAKEVDDTITAYDEGGLMVNVDVDKEGVPCGVEILFHGEGL